MPGPAPHLLTMALLSLASLAPLLLGAASGASPTTCGNTTTSTQVCTEPGTQMDNAASADACVKTCARAGFAYYARGSDSSCFCLSSCTLGAGPVPGVVWNSGLVSACQLPVVYGLPLPCAPSKGLSFDQARACKTSFSEQDKAKCQCPTFARCQKKSWCCNRYTCICLGAYPKSIYDLKTTKLLRCSEK